MKYSVLSKKFAVAAFAIASITSASAEAPKLDDKLPEYKVISGVSGTINSVGSDTLNNLMQLWGEGFKAKYPNVSVQIQGAGSSTAPPALIEGVAQLGPMSREMKGEEIDEFEKKYGYKPTAIGVSVDALAVFAHKDNPIKGLTMQEVDSIFSSTFRAGGNDITKWGEVGLDAWSDKAISLYGRNSASGTYGFFKEIALKGGDFKSSLKEQPGSSAVVQGIASELTGLGYSGIGYATKDVRALPLGTKKGEYAEANYDNCINGSYPLARFLYVYVNASPTKEMDVLTREFMKFVCSKEGQKIVLDAGYFPLTAEQATKFVAALK